ncbi:MAG: hypothetical protein M3Q03_12485 [Chloroflexota bacterium]|nr:hypothetical protein [Chloroflexota bacterium]
MSVGSQVAGVDPSETEGEIRAMLRAQAERWDGPLANHLLYARLPTILRGARAMWTYIAASRLVEPGFQAPVNRRAAALNGWQFEETNGETLSEDELKAHDQSQNVHEVQPIARTATGSHDGQMDLTPVDGPEQSGSRSSRSKR